MSKRKVLVNYSENDFNCIFGVFEMVGSLGSAAIQKDAQENVNEKNLEYMRERDAVNDARYTDELNYNRALQERIFEREDTAFQRQAEDMSAVGLNPLLAQGGARSGDVVSSPSIPANATSPNLQAPNQSIDLSGFENALGNALSAINEIEGVKTNRANRDLLNSQKRYQDLINEGQAAKNAEFLASHGIHIDVNGNYVASDVDFKDKKASQERNSRVNDYQEKYGVNDTTPSSINAPISAVEAAEKTATNMKKMADRALENNPDMMSSDNTMLDRLNQVGDDYLNEALIPFQFYKKVKEKGFLQTLKEWHNSRKKKFDDWYDRQNWVK